MILTHACAGLPNELLGQRIVAHPALDPAARLALFRSCHTLARMVLQHAPSSKRVTHKFSICSGGAWSPTLANLFGAKWQPLPPPQLDLELRVESIIKWRWQSASLRPLLPPPPSFAISQHVSRLHLSELTLNTADLAAWQLHDPARWPHLQHLTVSSSTLPQPPAVPAPPLPPIPGLQSASLQLDALRTATDTGEVLPLAAHVRQAKLGDMFAAPAVLPSVVGGLPRLTRMRVDRVVESQATLEALIQHPTLEHVEIGGLRIRPQGLRERPCRWRTLTLWGGVDLHDVASLPLAGLERLTIASFLGVSDEQSDPAACAAGVAALQQLHGQGRLALVPRAAASARRAWDEGRFTLANLRVVPGLVMPLLHLVLEAGRGVNALQFDWQTATLARLQQEVAPLLQQHAGKIRTVCFEVWLSTPGEWCAGVLGVLPLCVTHVRAWVWGESIGHALAALVRGGAAALGHPLTLTLMHRGRISAGLEAELLHLAAGAGVGEGGAQQGLPESLLALEVLGF